MNHYDRVCAYIDLDAIRLNVENIKSRINKNTQIIAVIKTDGYGHGAVAIAHELEHIPSVYGFGVATAEEAYILRKARIKKPIIAIGYTFCYSYEELIRQNIQITVFKDDMLEEIIAAARKIKIKAKVHIKVDTAMSRIGIKADESGLAFVRKVLQSDMLEPIGIFTHFAKADFANLDDATKQLSDYKEFLIKVSELESETGKKIELKHCSNSAGIISMPEANMDAVRAGISLYGLAPSNEVSTDIVPVTPALTLKSCIIYIKEIKAGAKVSYGGTFTASKNMRIATIPVGYGDGYPRTLSGKGHILIHGQEAPILGRICMDQFMVDISHIRQAKELDEVILIGRDGKKTITMEYLGDLSGRFNYELACDLGKRIPRLYLKGGNVIAAKDYFDDYKIDYFN